MTPVDWNRVDDVFQAALAVPAEERRALVERACASDTALAHEVNALLDAHDASTGFLEQPLGTAFEAAPPVPPGLRIGPYELVREIGQGGMGTVYLGRRVTDNFEQRVAIKITRAPVADSAALRRFESERGILASLQHPNIVTLLDGGTTSTGLPYLITELIDGEPLTAFARRHRLTLEARLALFQQVCAGVHVAHQHSVVHRDLKPANILVTADGVAKVLDFGVAKLLDPRVPDLTRASAFNAPLTPNYASPEQLQGRVVTTASDVYALGVILYELLAGVRPRELDDRPIDDVLRDVTERTAARPSDAAAQVRDLPYAPARLRGDLDAVVLKATRLEPDARYASADELSHDLERVRHGHPVTAREPSLGYLASRLLRRHRLSAATAAVALVGVLTALGVALTQYRQAEQARAEAEARFADVRRLANSLIFRLDETVRSKSPTEARQLIVSEALQYLDRLAGTSSDPTLLLELAEGYRRVADIQGGPGGTANLGDRDGALASARKALAILEGLGDVGALDQRRLATLVSTHRLMSGLLPKEQRAASAQAALAAAEQWLQRERSDEARLALASARFSLASLLDVAGMRAQFEAAGREFEALLAERPDDPARMRNVALVDKNLVEMLAAAGDNDDALRRAQRAAALDERRLELAPMNRQVRLDAAISYAQLATRQHDLKERLGLYERSLALREQVAHDDPADAFARALYRRSLVQVGREHWRAGDDAKARDAALRALALFAQENPASIDPSEAFWRGSAELMLATTEGRAGRRAEGCARLTRALVDLRAAETPVRPLPAADIAAARTVLPDCGADRPTVP